MESHTAIQNFVGDRIGPIVDFARHELVYMLLRR
jgi:hypothetical protein